MTKIKLIKSLLHTFKKIDSVSISNEERFKLAKDYTLVTQIPTKLVNPKLTKLFESH